MPESAQTLDRGVRVLFALADAPTGRTVAALAADLGLARPVVYRLLTTLAGHGLVRRTPDGSYRMGLAVLDLARRAHPLLRDAALPALRALAERVGATAHLTVLDGGEALAVAVVEPSWTAFHVAYREGARHPLAHGAAGRALLLTPEADPPYVVTEGELQPGAHGIAAPVHGVPALQASVGVVALAPLDTSAVAPEVLSAATRIAGALS